MTTGRTVLGPSLLVLALPLIGVGPLAAQTTTPPAAAAKDADAKPWLAVVTGDNVLVRSGPGDSYYPFARVKRGEVVRVVGSKYSWARITVEGPAFADAFGYVRVPKAGRARLELDPDGRSARALRRAEILAPNLNTQFNPADSWKSIVRIQPDERLRILETIDTDRATIHKVPLPDVAEGFVSANFLEPAPADRIAVWEAARRRLAGGPPVSPPSPPPAATAAKPNAPATPAPTKPPAAAAGSATEAPAPRPVDPPVDVVRARPETTAPPPAAVPANAPPPTPERTTEGDAATPPATPAVTPSTPPAEPAVTPGTPPAKPAAAPPAVARERRPDAASRDVAGRLRSADAPAATPDDAPERPLTDRERYEVLETAFQRLRSEPIESAELAPLLGMYQQLQADADPKGTVAVYAQARAKQLRLWADLQTRQRRLRQLERQVARGAGTVQTAGETVIANTSLYTAEGTLTRSSIFTGRRLPELLRIFDTNTSLTTAYVRPKDIPDLENTLGRRVGIVGDVAMDPKLRVKVVTVVRKLELIGPAVVSAGSAQ